MTRAAGGGRKTGVNVATAPAKELLTRVKPPEQLRDENAIAIWKDRAKILADRKMLTAAVLPMLIAWCNSFSLMIEADTMITDEGLLSFSDKGGAKKHPALTARSEAVNQMARLGSLLGFDPMSYQRLAGGGNDDEGGNEFDDF
ncbi:phage terminase small subunit P27 family [Motilimonas cestriensis]|uniref:Phage terminase small subunit P27 family n=1 Tax=Motilimonas cestriensis TaxID=2742685 RepID=A0ABS8WDT1_9GAMM|nr:phage terminase small subunit P27 family [Motilimonas cestriensis]MCE2597211.1 phage terminase small subunit P27 family [Motilimonas cestriensis]